MKCIFVDKKKSDFINKIGKTFGKQFMINEEVLKVEKKILLMYEANENMVSFEEYNDGKIVVMFYLNGGSVVLETERSNYEECFECLLMYMNFLAAERVNVPLENGKTHKALRVFVD